MKFIWYDGSIEFIKDNRIRESFKHFILIKNEADRENHLDDLDDVLEDMDDLFEDKNMEYTKEHSDYLQTKSKEILASLKEESLKSLLKDKHIEGKTTVGLNLETFPDDYTLNDVNDNEKTDEIIGKPEEGVLEREQDYPLEDIYNRIKDKHITYTKEATARTSKLEMSLILPAETPEDELGKLKYWEKKNATPRLHETDSKPINFEPKKIILSTGDFKDKLLEYNLMMQTQVDPDTNEEIDYIENDFDRDITSLVWKDVENREKYFGNFIPKHVLDPYILYDLNMDVTFHLMREIAPEDMYEIDERGEITEETEGEGEPIKIANPNYGEFKLDEDGNKIPKHNEEDMDSLMHMTIKIKLIPQRIIKLETGRAKTTGATERIKPVAGKFKTGRAGEFEGKKLNMARKDYLSFVRARMRDLEEAIKVIPIASSVEE